MKNVFTLMILKSHVDLEHLHYQLQNPTFWSRGITLALVGFEKKVQQTSKTVTTKSYTIFLQILYTPIKVKVCLQIKEGSKSYCCIVMPIYILFADSKKRENSG